MTTSYEPQPGIYVGRPPCLHCGANFRLHYPPSEFVRPGLPITGAGLAKLYERGVELRCPVGYRPETLEVALRDLAEAEAAGDQSRIFVARGEVQRLGGRPA